MAWQGARWKSQGPAKAVFRPVQRNEGGLWCQGAIKSHRLLVGLTGGLTALFQIRGCSFAPRHAPINKRRK